MKKVPNCYLSVGDVGHLTGHGRATVQKWVAKHNLKPAYSLPGNRGHYRIELNELRRFLRNNEMPTIETYLSVAKVKIVVKTFTHAFKKVPTIKKFLAT